MGQFSTLALIAANAALSAASAASRGNARAQSASFNAAALTQRAQTQRTTALAEERRLRRAQSRDLSAQAARFAARGIDTSTGSPLLAQEDAAAESEFEALLARAGGLARARESDLRAKAAASSAENARTSGLLNAGSSLLSSAERIPRLT